MGSIEDRGYYIFFKNKKGDYLKEKRAFELILSSLPKDFVPKVVVELFGGVGLFASLVPNSWRKQKYISYDHDSKCVEIFSEKHPWAKILLEDSFKVDLPETTEFLTADFNSYTLLKHFQERYLQLIDRISRLSNLKFLQVTDSAVSKLHLNGKVYSKKMGEVEDLNTLEKYLKCLASFYKKNYNLGLIKVFYHSNASYLLFEKNKKPNFQITKVTEMTGLRTLL